jgi:membrane-associated phospholipid phosphatase
MGLYFWQRGRVPAAAMAVFVALAVSPVARIVLGDHSVEQVIVGSLCGAACGFLYVYVVSEKAVQGFCDSPFGRFFEIQNNYLNSKEEAEHIA